MRRSVKSRDSESYRRRLLIDRLKLMPSEPRELSRRVRDKPEKEKDLSIKRDREFRPTSRLPDRSSSPKSSRV